MDYPGSFNNVFFIWVNHDGGHHYAWLDASMVVLSAPVYGVIPMALITVFAFWRSGRSAWRILALMVLLVLLADLSGALMKHWFAATRPCEALNGVRLLVESCGRNSFPSNHAINMAAIATFIGWHYRALLAPLACLAFLVGVSRVYVGVHYPGDVLFGWIWGALVASLFYWACQQVVSLLQRRKVRSLLKTSAPRDLS